MHFPTMWFLCGLCLRRMHIPRASAVPVVGESPTTGTTEALGMAFYASADRTSHSDHPHAHAPPEMTRSFVLVLLHPPILYWCFNEFTHISSDQRSSPSLTLPQHPSQQNGFAIGKITIWKILPHVDEHGHQGLSTTTPTMSNKLHNASAPEISKKNRSISNVSGVVTRIEGKEPKKTYRMLLLSPPGVCIVYRVSFVYRFGPTTEISTPVRLFS